MRVQFKELSQAYDVLSNPEKRELYDQYGEDGLMGEGGMGGAGHDPFDFFKNIFGESPFGGKYFKYGACACYLLFIRVASFYQFV